MELEEPTAQVSPAGADTRPHLPEPPPVRLLAIADVKLPAVAGVEKELDAFYVGLLKFERDAGIVDRIVYNAERWRLVYSLVETPPARDDYRPIMVQTPFFTDFVQALTDRETEFEWQKGVTPGVEAVFLRDPAGFWVSVSPIRMIA